MLLSALHGLRRTIDDRRLVEVGWLLRTDHAGFIWHDPKPLGQWISRSKHPKSVSRCPAVVDHEARMFQVLCPLDLRLRVCTDQEQPRLVNVDGSNASVIDRTLAQIAFVFPREQWRHRDRPLLQIKTPYTFIADEEVYLMQLPPLLHFNRPTWPGVVIGGRVPIHIWPRPLAWAFEWHDIQQDLVLRRGEPWFYCRFETMDASRHVRLVEAALTPQLKEYFAGLNGVVNYVNGTFNLFDIARRRRPERLLVRAHR
jgi:hypothetical protein